MIKAKKSKLKKSRWSIFSVLLLILLLIYAISLFALLIWGLITSFKSTMDFKLMGNVLGLPDLKLSADALRFGNYILMLENMGYNTGDKTYSSALFGEIVHQSKYVGIFDYILNTFVYAVVGSVLYAMTTMTVAYLCAKFKYKFSKILYTTMLVILTIPIVGSAPSKVAFTRDLGLYNNYLGMIIFNIHFSGIYFFVFHAYFESLSDAYMEAATIDGASQLQVYTRVIVPLSIKMLGTIVLLTFIQQFNGYQDALLFFPSLPTLSYAVFRIIRGSTGSVQGLEAQSMPQRIAACMLIATPLIVLFLATKNLILGNLTMGGVKE